jgi:hypothetical protein
MATIHTAAMIELTCARCGKPRKGRGKTPLCQPCAATLVDKRRGPKVQKPVMFQRHRSSIKVTLPRVAALQCELGPPTAVEKKIARDLVAAAQAFRR